uniref:Coiled-coil domain-containing protein 180 n=1 Tax=Pogona vitticeps TaxID=103695 RepID=A0ABM5F6F7_9SAUR
MILVGVSRVVPSGKVYRQIFDDEINLVRTLGEARNKLAQHKLPQIPGNIPLVKDIETCTGHGFLTQRQQAWVEGMPNDDYTENPVQYKEATTLAFLKSQEGENVAAAREVRGLAEVIIPGKKNSNLLERLSESRKCRYEDAVAGLKEELASLGKEMEQAILEPGTLFLRKLSESDQTVASLFQTIASDTSLETYTIEDFEKMWSLVVQETSKRKQWIRELDEALLKAEAVRTGRIKDLLKKYTKMLEDASYLLSSDVHRFIHKEAMMINQALLANQRAIARLFVNLTEAHLKRDVDHRSQLEERKKIWKAIKKEGVISTFREFMESERIQNPNAVKTELENMLKDQRSLHEKRTALLYSLCNLLPPTHSKAEVNEWYESVVAINKRIDTHNVQYMMRIRIQYEKVCQACLSKVEECKQKLLEMKVCSEQEAEKIVNPYFFQLVGKLQSRFEREVETMDDDLERLAKHTEVNCRHLYQHFQDALVLFDKHQRRLAHQEDELHNKLNECRNKHENLNKLREVHLDVSIDKLRTQSSDEKLKSQLEKIYTALDFIRAGYTAFHQDLLLKITAHPDHILHELISYSLSLSRYFYVKQIYKGKPLKKTQSLTGEEDAASGLDEAVGTEETSEDAAGHRNEDREPPEEEDEEEEEEGIEEEEEEEGAAGTKGSEKTEKPGEVETSTLEGKGRDTPTEKSSFVLGSDDMEKLEDESSPLQEAGGAREADDGAKSAPRSSEGRAPAREVFTTSSGNIYELFEHLRKSKAKKSEKYYAGKLKSSSLPPYLQQVYLPESFFIDLRNNLRLQFFEHLETWFADTLAKTWSVVGAKKEEVNSEVQLRIHLHEPRRERIEKDIYHVRLAELRFHSERLARHCAGVVEALNKERAAFFKLREDQNNVSRTFRHRIQDMENIFLTESRAERLVSLSNNLHIELINHVEVMQLSLRSYRQYLEEALGKLREANTDFLRACRLFADGGNFSSEELDVFMKRLHKENGRIDFVEGLIMIDLEKMESTYLEQATEVIGKFENRFRFLAMDRVFMEKIQRFLTNIQVKIKSEVAISNVQTQTLNSLLEKLVLRIDACAHPNVDKESITPEELYEFAMSVMEELKKRSKYLNCLLPGLEPVVSTLNGPSVRASLTISFPSVLSMQEAKPTVMGVECTALLNPSRMGKPAFDDAALSVIRHLTGFQRFRKVIDTAQDRERSQSIGGEGGSGQPDLSLLMPPGTRGRADSLPGGQNAAPVPVKNSTSVGRRVSRSTSSTQKYVKLTRADRKLQIFGDKPKETDNDHFKGIIFSLVWDSFDNLMGVAEEFYRRDKHQITRPEYLQETFEQCIDVLGQKLLMYLQQADEYHVACVSEFRGQLQRFEELLPRVIQLVVWKCLKDHEHLLFESTEKIQGHLQDQLQKLDLAKDKNKAKLCPTLGHPHNLPQLEALCQEETERQEDQAEGIRLSNEQLEVCVIEGAQRFVSALAACTEKILAELDDSLTFDDVQQGKTETPREKTSTLLRRKKAGLSLEIEECRLLVERGSRTWPGLPRTTLRGLPNQIICRETASVTTAKSTLGHKAAVEERDAVYLKFTQLLEVEFARIKEENTAHLMKAQHWADWWKKSVQKIKQLYL